MSKDTVFFVERVSGSAGAFSIYAWNPNGKKYTGGNYTVSNEVVTAYQNGQVIKYDFLRGGIVKY